MKPAENGRDWTRDTPDDLLAIVRLACGHAKIVLANVGVPGRGSSTWCDPCGSAVEAVRHVARGPVTEKPATRASQAPHGPHTPPGGPGLHPAPADASEGRTAPGERFEGHGERECGEHRTTGRRAWCFDCQEWCYPDIPCRGCELPNLRAALAAREETDHA